MKAKHAAALCMVWVACAVAQDNSAPARQTTPATAPAPSGMVSGRVICGDTQRPARFAEVLLTGVAASENQRGRMRMSLRTDLDGTFSGNVPPGDYYVTGSATGYISQAALLQEALGPNATSGDADAALARLPVVHVAAGVPSTVNISLDRGAVIAGVAAWDDGTPAAGITVSVVAQTTSSSQSSSMRAQFQGFGGFGNRSDITDDRGRFRIVGLTPGTYVLRATVIAPSPPAPMNDLIYGRNTMLLLYAPGKVRKIDATPITVAAGEERSDVQFLLDLRALHRVTGHVNATSGAETIGSGTVRITDSQDSSLWRTAQISADGSFNLTYVPAGTYTLTVPNAGPASQNGAGFQRGRPGQNGGQSSSPAVSFQPYQVTLTVADTDVSGMDIELQPATTASAK